MNCSDFWDIMAEYEEGSLAPAARLSAQAHLSQCPECALLAEAISGNRDLLEGDQGALLHKSILRRTSGTVCRRARRELKRLHRGGLDVGAAELLFLHLRACPSCRAAAAASPGDRICRLRRLFLAPGFDWLAAYAGALVVFAILVLLPLFRDSAPWLAAMPVARAALIALRRLWKNRVERCRRRRMRC
jgi:hypothetical protein